MWTCGTSNVRNEHETNCYHKMKVFPSSLLAAFAKKYCCARHCKCYLRQKGGAGMISAVCFSAVLHWTIWFQNQKHRTAGNKSWQKCWSHLNFLLFDPNFVRPKTWEINVFVSYLLICGLNNTFRCLWFKAHFKLKGNRGFSMDFTASSEFSQSRVLPNGSQWWIGPRNGRSALHYTCQHGALKATRVLLAAGSNPWLEDDHGVSWWIPPVRLQKNEMRLESSCVENAEQA